MEQLPFESMNETDVREEVIAPLLRKLGYRSGTQNNIVREQLLRYPRQFLGRKDYKKDPELRGKADYVLEIDNRLRWVIEAKAPADDIRTDDIEQACTYANHPEIRATYFALCNGRTLHVYRTDYSPNARAVLSMNYESFDEDFGILQNVLGREALLRDFPDIKPDVGVPIAPGLRSVARITNGFVSFEQNSLGHSVLNEMQTTIWDGAVERDGSGMIAFLKTKGPTRSLQEQNDRLGLSSFEMRTADSKLSVDGDHPTIFVYDSRVTLPAGESILDMSTWQQVTLPINVTCDVKAEATGVYREGTFSGTFITTLRYAQVGIGIVASGCFEIHLA